MDTVVSIDNKVSVDALTRHKSFLEEAVDPDSGLLDELLRNRALTAAEVRTIKSKDPYHERNAKLFEYITEQEKCEFFIDSLRNTRQTHIVNYLSADGEYRPEFGLHWPLTRDQLNILDDNQREMIDLIEMSELIFILYSREVINKRQKDIIESKQISFQKNEAFLEILRRCSKIDYNTTIDCFKKSNQPHLSEILANGGVIVPVHVRTDDTAEGENYIIEEITTRLGDRSLEECDRIWEQTRLKIIAVKLGQSIVLYVYCQTLKDLQLLRIKLNCGGLKRIAKRILKMSSRGSRKTNVLEVTVEENAFTRAKQFAEGDASSIARLRTNLEIDECESQLKELMREIMKTQLKHSEVQEEERIEKLEAKNKYLTYKCKDLELKLKEYEPYLDSTDDKLWTSSPRRIKTIKGDGEKSITGIAIVDQELFITHSGTREIKVYDLSTLKCLSQFEIRESGSFYDMASCKINNCLYIMDKIENQNKIIRLTTNGKILRCWTTDFSWGSISVAFDSNIILTSSSENFILEYTSVGKKVRTVKLSKEAGLKSPTHAVKLRSDRFLVSHGQGSDSLHRVCVVDLKGNVRMAFGGKSESDNESIDSPGHMAIDSNGSIIVIDGWNNRLLLLDSKLEFRRVLIPKEMEEMMLPDRLAVDESTGRLFVVHGTHTNYVLVFEFCIGLCGESQ